MPETLQIQLLTKAIQSVIEGANKDYDSKSTKVLSKNRIAAYGSFKKIIEGYQVHSKKIFYVNDVNLNFLNNFLDYLQNEKKYSSGYALKKLADLKTVCLTAELSGAVIDSELKTYKAVKEKKQHIIYLNLEELEMIKIFPLFDAELENARKWLLIGCNIGQRAGDLLNLKVENFTKKNSLEVIELTQEKTGNQIIIPVQSELRGLIKDGFPIQIPLQKLNDQIKEICRLCGFTEMTTGVLYDEETKKRTEGNYEKYKLITSHVCRRTFAMNNFGKVPSHLLKQITGHTTEAILLDYIGKNSTPKEEQTYSLF